MTTKRRASYRLWVFTTLLVLAALACNLGASPEVDVRPTPEPDRPRATNTPETVVDDPEDPTPVAGGLTRNQLNNLIASTVQIYGLFDVQGEYQIGYTGSGTILTPEGMILTNAHVASPASQGDPEFEPDLLAIGLVEAEDEPPVAAYLAEVHAVDGFLDLAVIQIYATLDGDEIDPEDLNLPYTEIGDSDELRVGDHLNIFGFPGIGGETLTFTTGNVAGFTAEEEVGNRAWVKTDATIAGGNSGGLGANDQGALVGVPTRGGGGSDGAITDCRVVQDTNGDGRLTEEDTCIPIGGFINALRPVNLAMPLIQAAERGLAYVSPFEGPTPVTTGGTGNEEFGPVAWYTIDADGEPDEQVTTFPEGATAVGAVWEFAGMADGVPWGIQWLIDGEVVFEDTFAWEEGEEGVTYNYLHNQGDPLPNGEYQVGLFAGEGLPLLSQGATTVGGGGAPPPPPSSGDIQLYGWIFDGDSEKPIVGAQFVVLMPGVTYEQWDGSEAQVYAWAETDNEGFYALPALVARDTPYTIVAGANGYRTKFGDNIVFTNEDPDELEFSVALVK
jgi:S1-C subfamily serine protease